MPVLLEMEVLIIEKTSADKELQHLLNIPQVVLLMWENNTFIFYFPLLLGKITNNLIVVSCQPLCGILYFYHAPFIPS